jgi:hypothetical protein
VATLGQAALEVIAAERAGLGLGVTEQNQAAHQPSDAPALAWPGNSL